MPTQIVPFNFESNEVRTVTDENGNFWFVLRDVLGAMGTSTRPADAKESVIQVFGRGVVDDIPLQTAGGTQQTAIVSEAGTTYLISRGNTETSQKLNRFIHAEVLPSLRKTGGYSVQQAAPATQAQLVEITFNSCLNLARLAGITDQNQAILSADRATKELAGQSPLKLLGVTHLVAADNCQVLTPSDLALRLGVKKREANPLLTDAGMQTALRDHKNRLYYTPTELGQSHAVMLDTGKKHENGTPVLQLKWKDSVLPILEEHLQSEAAE